MNERIVKVNAGGGYDVRIGSGLLENCGGLLAKAAGTCSAAIITGSNVAKLYLDTVCASMTDAGFHVSKFVYPCGEASKNMDTLSDILEFLAENRLTRADLVVALGGGVTGDMAGFAAAVYLRGIRFVQIPTTLLADVDSSVGGKTGVNLKAGKNLAGAFKQPELVICDTDCLKTLPEAEFSNGLAEAIKCGVLNDRALFDILTGDDIEARLPDIIEACVSYKRDLVERDELDNGDRRFLNLGHTIGHAIEKCSGFTIPHGYAIAIGMVMISRVGEKLRLTEPGTADLIEAVLRKNGLPTATEFSASELLSAALADKKRMGDKITLVFPRHIGNCFLKTVSVSDLEHIIEIGKAE